MCLILAAWQADPRFPLVIAANRDEYFARPTRSAAFWPESPDLLGGRDLSAGGTWLGITRTGASFRFAALTNFRDPANEKQKATSRGSLVSGFLQGKSSALDYLKEIESVGSQYNGFNLLVCDGDTLACHNNIVQRTEQLTPGIHGLSNHALNTPWPKVRAGIAGLKALIEADGDEPLFSGLEDLLQDRKVPADGQLPDTGVGLVWERRLSSIFIASASYGTRSSSILTVSSSGRIEFKEIGWGQAGAAAIRSFGFDSDCGS